MNLTENKFIKYYNFNEKKYLYYLMNKTLKEKINVLKKWYQEGTVKDNCAVYNDKVIQSIQIKCKEICKKEGRKVDFLSEVIQQGYYNATLPLYSPKDIGVEPYDFQKDVAQQNNAFEYFKLGKIVEEYGGNGSMENGLDKEDQKKLLHTYRHVFIPLMNKLNSHEKKFLKDILKLSGGVISWYAVTYDNSLPSDYLTKDVSNLAPKLPTMSKISAKKIQAKSSPKGTKKRPRGRAPKGKKWDYNKGCWINL